MQIRTHYFCVFLLTILVFFTQKSTAQTSFEGGDIAIIGVNANNNACAGTGGEDVITFVAFKDITNSTNFDITDNGWERVNVGQWGDSEGTYRVERTGGTISAGTTFELTLLTGFAGTQAANPGWTITNLNVPTTLDRVVNMNSGGDQMYVMQGGTWDNGGETGEHDATYDGKILYGFNTRTTWSANGTSQQSNLHPDVDPCFFMNPTGGTTNYVHYTGPLTPATQFDWINRIKEPSNWTSYTNCNDYNTVPQLIPATLPILPSEMSVDCAICNGGCGSYMETLTFNLPLTGGPFDIVYTDGTTNFPLTGISDGHTIMVSVSASTTYSLVSVTANNNCPIYSNFGGAAVITFSGSGGGGMASFSGGGILCSENCTTITLNVAGGTAPFSVSATVNYPPIVNNFPFTVPATSNSFVINVCADGILPSYNIGSNTLTLPNFIVGNLSFSLTGITDNTGCAGTVDPTPLILTIETSPTANPAALTACDQGGSIANFDLTSVDNTVNGGNGNTVTWFLDMGMLNPISTPSNFPSGNTTVYAVSNTVNCNSEPQPVTLTVNPSPSAMATVLTECTSTGVAFFDLTSVNNTINGGTGNPVTWFSNVAGTIPISDPTNHPSGTGFVFAVVTANGCSSQPTPISLVVNQAPTGITTTMTVCESTTIPGFGDFDLATLNNTVNGGTGQPVAWFFDISGVNPITSGQTLASNNTIVYAFVGTAPCTSTATAVTLFVTPTPSATTTTMDVCAQVGNQAVFDLTTLNNTVNGTSGNNVSWFTDVAHTDPILTPSSFLTGSTFVFATVNAGNCSSGPTPIQLTVIDQPTANSTSATACDLGNGTGIFYLDILANTVNSDPLVTVNWFSNMSGTNPIFSPYTSGATTIYAIVSNGTCSSTPTPVNLAIDIAPSANSAAASLCDSGNGTADFILTNLENTVNGNTTNTVTWYSDFTLLNEIFSPYNSSTTTIFAVVSNGNCDSQPTLVNLNVTAAPSANTAAASLCDSGNGTADFILTNLENTVNGGTTNTVTWYSDFTLLNEIFSPYNSSTTTVFAVVSNGGCDSQPALVNLNITAAPSANAAAASLCDSGNGTATFDLTTLENTVNGGSGDPVSWFSDINGLNSIPTSYSTGPTTVFAFVSNGGCTSVAAPVNLTLDAAPSANTFTVDGCSTNGISASFDLNAMSSMVNSNPAYTVNWFLYQNGTNPLPSTFTTATTPVWAIVSNPTGGCAAQPVEITLNVILAPTANTASATECEISNGEASFILDNLASTVNGGSGNVVTWFSDMNGLNPIVSPYSTATTTVYGVVNAINNCNSLPVAVNLTVTPSPTANTASDSECDLGNGTADFILTNLENTVNGGSGNTVSWYSDMAANNQIFPPYNSTTTTIYAIVTNGNCNSQVTSIDLTVQNLLSANTASDSECDLGDGTADFNLTNLENMVNGGSGNTVSWYSDMAANNQIFPPYNSTTTTIYATITDGNCTSPTVAINLTVDPLPTANTASASECDLGNGTADFNLTLLENTVNDGTGNLVSWFSDASGVSSIPTNFNSGSTTVYATVTNGNCTSSTVAITLTVGNSPTANTAASTECDLGNGTADFDLSLLENTVNGGSGNIVSWFSDAGAINSIPTNYNSATTTVYAVIGNGNCISSPVMVTLTVDAMPNANTATSDACDEGGAIATFDLTLLESTVNNGSGLVVSWYFDAAAMNSIPTTYATISTTVYAVVENGNCPSSPVGVDLNVLSLPTAADVSDAACDNGNGTGTFDLTTLENIVNGGSGFPVTWYNDANGMNQIIPPYTFAGGTIYSTVFDGNCTSEIQEALLFITPLPDAFSTATSLCDDGTGQATFDLALLENTINGGNGNMVNWFDDAAGLNAIGTSLTTAPTSVFAQVTDGNCTSSIVEVELSLSSNTTLTIIDTLCFGESMMVNNQVYDAGTPSGIEMLPNTNGCDSTITVNLTFESEITGSISASTNSICSGNNVTLTFNLTGGSDFDIQYSEGFNLPVTLNNITDGYTIMVSPTTTTTYTLVQVTPLNSNCAPILPITQVTIDVEEIQVTAAATSFFANFNVSCFNQNDGSAMATPSSGTAPFDFQWSNGGSGATIQNIPAGNYGVTMTDANGCIAEATTLLTQPTEIQIETIAVSPPCVDSGDGQVIINNIVGGAGTYSYSFDNGGFGSIQNFPTTLDFIQPGNYQIIISDANGCTSSEEITLLEPVAAEINLPDDQTIELGESYEIESMPNFTPSQISWSNNAPCDTCLNQLVEPIDESTYVVTMLDENGCLATDEITIFIEKNQHVFIPNAFSPDDNGRNDIFYINAGIDVLEIKNFRVFNRWGETIFTRENFQPNDPTLGWDGYFRGKKLNPAVFVYFAEIVFKDGRVEIFKGDVTMH